MTRTEKGSGGIFDIFMPKAKKAVKAKTERKKRGFRSHRKQEPVVASVEKPEGRPCSEWWL
jgi:hypothetical protein